MTAFAEELPAQEPAPGYEEPTAEAAEPQPAEPTDGEEPEANLPEPAETDEDTAGDAAETPAFAAQSLLAVQADGDAAPAASTPTITNAALTADAVSGVFGFGIITGTGDEFDAVVWDPTTETNRGYDNTAANNIVRTFDTVVYNVTTTIENPPEPLNLVYQFKLPAELDLSMSTQNGASGFTDSTDATGAKTYTYTIPVATNSLQSGAVTMPFDVFVGNNPNGTAFTPEITVSIQGTDAQKPVENVKAVNITSVPAYNIVLAQNDTIDFYLANRSFDSTDANWTSANVKPTDFGYASNTVTGARRYYGFALEIARPDHSIKGAEFPSSTDTFTFDITLDYKSTSGSGQDLVTQGYYPMLLQYGPNAPGGTQISGIPFTKKDDRLSITTDRSCYDSGSVRITQEPRTNTLHVTLTDIEIDRTKFPKYNAGGQAAYGDYMTKIWEGMLSSWSFVVVYPSESTNNTALTGAVTITATAGNLEIGDATLTETNMDDNAVQHPWNFDTPGKINHTIQYTQRAGANGKNGTWQDSYSPSCGSSDKDVAAAGAADVAFTVHYQQQKIGDAYTQYTPATVQQLVLLDSDVLTNIRLNEAPHLGSTADATGLADPSAYDITSPYTLTVRYGRLNDPSRQHLDGEAMRTVSYTKGTLDSTSCVSDFTFYDTFASIPDGRCDAVLLTYTKKPGAVFNDKTTLTLYSRFAADVRPEAAGKVAMITLVSEAKDASGNTLTWAADDGTTASAYLDNRARYSIPTYNGEGYYQSNAQASGLHFHPTFADALYIVPYFAKFTKTVAQKAGTEAKSTYQVSDGERYVDYCLTPTLEYQTDVDIPDNAVTTVIFEDTLPAGMTYAAGSAYWGGSYTDMGATRPGLVAGGRQLEPAATTNAAGQTVLRWEISGVRLRDGTRLPALYYSCKLGNELDPDHDVVSNRALTNTVGIHTTEDKRDYAKESGNLDTATITPIRNQAFFISKKGGPWMELNDASYYDLIVSNTGGTAVQNLVLVDAMPYQGKNDTVKGGSYKLTSLTLNLTAIKDYAANDFAVNDFAVYYTTDPAKAGLTTDQLAAGDLTTAGSTWQLLPYTTSTENGSTIASFSIPQDVWPTAIVYTDTSLPNNAVVNLHMNFDVVGAVGDLLVNKMTVTATNTTMLTATAETKIVSRTLEGTVWEDTNKNGLMDSNEPRLQGVKASLLRYDEATDSYVPATLYTKPDGTPYPNELLTDANGHYRFEGLPAGKYRVRFTDGTTDLGSYDVTRYAEGNDPALNSKVQHDAESIVTTDSELTAATITEIDAAPTLEALETVQHTTWNMPDQNLGLIRRAVPSVPTPTPTRKPTEATPTQPTKPSASVQPTQAPRTAQPAAASAAQKTAQAAIPQTSDPLPVGLLAAMALVSLSALAALWVTKRRKKL